MLVTLPKDFR
jgi:hypothetical protein